MKKIINRFRLKWLIATKSLNYSLDFFERVYKIYINHSKVIHYRDGLPVYSLSTPAIFSKPAANMFARMIYGSVQNRSLPNLMSFAVNDECNVNCEHCSFFNSVNDKKKKVLSTEECVDAIKSGQDLGVSVINFVGGEPLLREDIFKIIKSVDKNLSTTVLFTNGVELSFKARKLKISGLDSVYVSIDSSDRERHDKKRGKSGIYKKALEGIRAAKKTGMTVGISCCMMEKDFRDGELDRIIELGKDEGVHEVLVFDAVPTGRLKNNKELIDNNDWIEELIDSVEGYNKDLKYPGILIYAYSTSYKSTGCSGGTSYFYLSPYGDIFPCDFNHKSFGNIREEKLHKIWDRFSSDKHFSQASWNGCKMKDSEYLKGEKCDC